MAILVLQKRTIWPNLYGRTLGRANAYGVYGYTALGCLLRYADGTILVVLAIGDDDDGTPGLGIGRKGVHGQLNGAAHVGSLLRNYTRTDG